jgi:hypothetical protein
MLWMVSFHISAAQILHLWQARGYVHKCYGLFCSTFICCTDLASMASMGICMQMPRMVLLTHISVQIIIHLHLWQTWGYVYKCYGWFRSTYLLHRSCVYGKHGDMYTSAMDGFVPHICCTDLASMANMMGYVPHAIASVYTYRWTRMA